MVFEELLNLLFLLLPLLLSLLGPAPTRSSLILLFPCRYIINVLNTKVGDPFETWVETKVVLRHEALKQENVIEMDAAVAEAFRASQAVSSKYCRYLYSLTNLCYYRH